MPTCEKCNEQWTWKETLKTTFTLDPAMTCPKCGRTQYQTQKSRIKSSILNFVILLPLPLNLFFDIPGVILLSSFPILFVLVMTLYPFLMKISSKEEYTNLFMK
jgi:CXXC-20-CXXC protein